MAIRVIGANPRTITAEMILEAATKKRLKDAKTGTPLQITYLDWNMRKNTYHQAKTKGDWDDVFITRTGSGQLELEYRHPGSLEWIKDPIAGDFSAVVAVTERNVFLLASHYYDRQWTVRDPVLNAKIKTMADKIDEDNKKIPMKFLKIFKTVNPKTGQYETVEKEVQGNMYEFHVHRREQNFKAHSEQESLAMVSTNPAPISDAMDALTEKERNLAEREALVRQREIDLGIVEGAKATTKTPLVPAEPGYTEPELSGMRIQDLRKLAREKFGLDAFKKSKSEIISDIQKIQINSAGTPPDEMVSAAEVETELQEEAITD